MDTKSFVEKTAEGATTSRLPAGSTLIVNGIHVPHPHAEVNLAGAGDPRVGETDAVTERTVIVDDVLRVTSEPLAEEVRPQSIAMAATAEPVSEAKPEEPITGKKK